MIVARRHFSKTHIICIYLKSLANHDLVPRATERGPRRVERGAWGVGAGTVSWSVGRYPTGYVR